jgi:hypothetical protein
MIHYHIDDSPRALLIQDVHELRTLFEQVWVNLRGQLDPEDALRWIIADWLRNRHGLLVWDHNPTAPSMQVVKRHLRIFLDLPLNQLCEKYIVAPVLYKGCRDITMDLRGVDLYIWYFK